MNDAEKNSLTTSSSLPIAASAGAVGLSRSRKLAAFGVAALSDAISAFASFIPPVEWAVDGLTALTLFALLGFRWILVPVLVVEAIPGLAVFPTWTLVVTALIALDKKRD